VNQLKAYVSVINGRPELVYPQLDALKVAMRMSYVLRGRTLDYDIHEVNLGDSIEHVTVKGEYS
jgi:hypothetical protein